MVLTDEEEGGVPHPPSSINTAMQGQQGTPSTLGEGSFAGGGTSVRESPTRAATAARRAAAAAASSSPSSATRQARAAGLRAALGHTTPPRRNKEKTTTLPVLEESENEDMVAEEDVTKASADDDVVEVVEKSKQRPTKRHYDTSVRDQVRTYYTIDGPGSYETGGIFICSFCKKKKFEWNTSFNITLAKQHLFNGCSSVPKDIEEWVAENLNSVAGFTSNVRNKARKFEERKKGVASTTGSVASSQQGSMRQFTRPNHIKSSLPPAQGHAVIMANIEMFLGFFESPTRVNHPGCVQAMVTASGTGLQKFIPSDQQVWNMVKHIDEETQEYMENRLKMEPGNLTIGFDGVTALGKHATLYTLSKGTISLFLTIR